MVGAVVVSFVGVVGTEVGTKLNAEEEEGIGFGVVAITGGRETAVGGREGTGEDNWALADAHMSQNRVVGRFKKVQC